MSPRPPRPALERLLARPGLGHGEAQIALAVALSGADRGHLDERLDEASRWLFGAGGLAAHDQAHALADLLTNRLGLVPERSDHRALLIDHAFAERRAHPLTIAAIGYEVARRAGVPTFVGTCSGHPWTVVRGEEGMALVGSACLPAHPRAEAVRSRCPHQVAHSVLTEIRSSAPPELALRAERLRRALPVRGCAQPSDRPAS